MPPASAWWRFLPPGSGTAADALTVARGRGALSRALRAARHELGAVRAARLLRARPSRPDDGLAAFRLRLVAPVQPQSLVDPLLVAFAIAGLAVEIEPVDGFGAADGLAEDAAGIDAVLLVEPPDEAASRDIVSALAARAASLWKMPVAVARFEAASDTEAGRAAGDVGIDVLRIDGDPLTALDRRFSASFGAILTAAAADRLADAAAGWAARTAGRAPKLVLTDLDGTLWDGILGERAAGEGALPVNPSYAEGLATLARRGIVLAVASRNDPADVAAAFAAGAAGPLRSEDVAAFAVGWSDKASLVAEALAALGLAPEHAVLVDDDPVNCAGVAARFPEMDVRLFGGAPEAFARDLVADPLLLGGGGDAARTRQYQARAGVERLRADTPDRAAFLAALDTRLTLMPLGPALLRRAAELGSRVNQFILCDHRPGVAELAARSSGFDVMVRLDDAFGAHGLVGLVLAGIDGDRLVVDNLFLSCRALERGVEDAMLAGLGEAARARGAKRIVGRLQALPRNEPARGWIRRIAALGGDGGWSIAIPTEAGVSPLFPQIRWADEEGDDA